MGVSKVELSQLTSQIMALETKVTELLAIVKSNQPKHEVMKVAEVSAISVSIPKVKVEKVKKVVTKKPAKKPAKKVSKRNKTFLKTKPAHMPALFL